MLNRWFDQETKTAPAWCSNIVMWCLMITMDYAGDYNECWKDDGLHYPQHYADDCHDYVGYCNDYASDCHDHAGDCNDYADDYHVCNDYAGDCNDYADDYHDCHDCHDYAGDCNDKQNHHLFGAASRSRLVAAAFSRLQYLCLNFNILVLISIFSKVFFKEFPKYFR